METIADRQGFRDGVDFLLRWCIARNTLLGASMSCDATIHVQTLRTLAVIKHFDRWCRTADSRQLAERERALFSAGVSE
jgi:hypothetical protein